MTRRIRLFVAGLSIAAAATAGTAITPDQTRVPGDTTWGSPATTGDTTWGNPPTDNGDDGDDGTVTPQGDTTWG